MIKYKPNSEKLLQIRYNNDSICTKTPIIFFKLGMKFRVHLIEAWKVDSKRFAPLWFNAQDEKNLSSSVLQVNKHNFPKTILIQATTTKYKLHYI